MIYLSLAIWLAIGLSLALIVRNYLRVTHRLARWEKSRAAERERLRKLYWPKLPPTDLAWLIKFRGGQP